MGRNLLALKSSILRVQAKERRDDKNPDYNNLEESLPSTSSYRAVAPGLVDP